MAVSKKYSIWAVQFDKTSDVILGAITRSRLDVGAMVRSEPTSGEVYARHQAVVGRKPMASFTTLDIVTALTEIATTGLYVTAATGSPVTALNLYCVPHAQGGTRTGGSVNRQYSMVRAFVVPRTLRVEHGGDASLDVDIIILTDTSANDPVQISDTVALPSGIADANRFTLGPVTLKNIVFDHVRSLELDFGINAVVETADSDIYPAFVSIQDIKPRLTIRGIDPTWLSKTATPPKAPFTGLVTAHADPTKFFLRKRTQDGASFVADGTAAHVKFTMAGFLTVTQGYDGSGSGAVETVAVLEGKYDGTNNPVVATTLVAVA